MKKSKTKIRENDKKAVFINIVVSILLVAVLSFISIGYALYGQTLGIRGTSSFGLQGEIAITNVSLTSSINVRSGSIPSFTNDSVDFNLIFEKAAGSQTDDYQAVYSITIDNATFYDYDFNLANFQPVITNSSGIAVNPEFLRYTLSGINLGDSIPAGQSVTFNLTMDFYPEEEDTYSVDGNMNTDLEEQPHGSILGSIPENAEGDLRESLNKDIAEFTVTVINTFQSSRVFTLNISDTNHFALVNLDGTPLSSYTIAAGTTDTFTFYVKRATNAIFTNTSFQTSISLSYSEASNVSCGNITLLVDKVDLTDRTPPVISNVTATINDATSDDTSNANVGSITVEWNGSDAESGVEKYYVVLCSTVNSVESCNNTYETPNDNPRLTITGLADGNYSFKVYGENKDGYQASAEDIASGNTTYCRKSISSSYVWHYTVALSNNSTNVTSITPNAVNRGKNYTGTITPGTNACGNRYTLANTIQVNMGGNQISSGNNAGQYNYTRGNNNGTLVVYGVTGNITVTVTAS